MKDVVILLLLVILAFDCNATEEVSYVEYTRYELGETGVVVFGYYPIDQPHMYCVLTVHAFIGSLDNECFRKSTPNKSKAKAVK
jgi:hypothetical protein